MMSLIAFILFLIFLFLAFMHIYWALGGRYLCSGPSAISNKWDFFKKITKTKFAKNDFRFYSPLCLVIAILTAVLAWHQPLTALCI